MYKIQIENRLNDGTWECSTYTEKFFKEKKEAKIAAFNLAATECNQINYHSDLKYKMHMTAGTVSSVAIISAPGAFVTPVKRYYVEQIDDTEAITIFFDSVSDLINSTIFSYSLGLFSAVYCLFNFGTDVVNLTQPYLYNSRTFDIVNMISETKYWINTYKSKYAGDTFIRECCQSMAFDLFCVIDSSSSKNDFKMGKMAFDKALQKTKLHQLWCEYLKEKNNEK